MPVAGHTIDAHRQHEFIATCPKCLMERRLPEGWQDILRASMDPDEARTWDGHLRCQNEHWPRMMVIVEAWRTPREPDGSVIVHLVDDGNRSLAACTGQPWPGVTSDVGPGTMLRFCQACHNLAIHGGYKESR